MIKDYLKTLPQFLLPKKHLTRLAGHLAGLEHSYIKNTLIAFFIKKFKVNMKEALKENPEDYKTFNDFFIRHLKPGLRTIAKTTIVSPVDGTISELGFINQGQLIQAKGHYYTVSELLVSEPILANRFLKGRFITLYLAPKDYHRIHMPIEGKLEEMIYIPGDLFSVQPATARIIPKLFAKNERLVLIFQTEVGKMAVVLVGATIVGAIGTSFLGEMKRGKQVVTKSFQNDNISLAKGEELGYFKLGSTVVLLFANDLEMVDWLPSLKAGSPIRYGEALGEKAAVEN